MFVNNTNYEAPDHAVLEPAVISMSQYNFVDKPG
jgi:hypothetical protein